MTEAQIKSLLRFSRAYCCDLLPWFAPVLFSCKIHLSEEIPVAAVDDHLNVYFNPKAITILQQSIIEKNAQKDISSNKAAELSKKEALSEIGFLWIHEISHILREHRERCLEMKAEPFLWNVAADLEINDSKWKGLKAPAVFPGVYPKTYNLPNGQIAEHYYQKLYKDREQKTQQIKSDLKNKDYRQQDADNPGGEDLLDEGSGVHGQKRPWEIASEEDEKSPSSHQVMDEMELERIRKSVAEEIKKAKTQGTIPGGWERWAENILDSKINWRKVLRHRMSVAVAVGVGSRTDYSFARPSRRQSVYNPVLPPSLTGNLEARICCVVDTSGSITPNQLSQIVGEVISILDTFHLPITVIPCDAKAYAPISIASKSDYVKLQKLPGGGGTNMIAGIEAALKMKQKPDSILVLTDGYTPYPKRPYKIPVIFGILRLSKLQQVFLPPIPPWKKNAVVEIEVGKGS